jgi:hypothetical protein
VEQVLSWEERKGKEQNDRESTEEKKGTLLRRDDGIRGGQLLGGE